VYRKAIEAGLDSADVCFNYAIVLDALGDTSQARVFYRRAITRERTFLAPYLNLARGYVRVGEYDSAAGAYREALSNGVDSLPIREGLAEVTGKLHLNGKK
jgi:Tfp pilus assembly protein PilF